MPIKDGEKQAIYLVWSQWNDGSIGLRDVSTTMARANRIRKHLAFEPRTLRVWVEPRETNHLYGQMSIV